MKNTNLIYRLSFLAVILLISSFYKVQAQTAPIKEKSVTYVSDGVQFNCFLAYNDQVKGKRPAILVIPEWWGLNDYTRMRARKLAELGYVAMAVDVFGEGKTAANPQEAQSFTGPFYKDPALGKKRLEAAEAKLKEFALTDPSNVAAIGYCFGGYVVLNTAKSGSDLKGVVSFHGGLGGVKPSKKLLKSKILVCHGAIDQFVTKEDVETFKHEMDSIGASYTFKQYENATHAFTNPESTANGKKFNLPIAYNAAADAASWNDMKLFFSQLFEINK
ncbi:MAG: dienelactone hydrolase family protein [Bacteroidetes bacterium]|nr:dienelactone hydrolase family protein [Bacteroidota bacterium]